MYNILIYNRKLKIFFKSNTARFEFVIKTISERLSELHLEFIICNLV